MQQNYTIPNQFIDNIWYRSKFYSQLFNSVNTIIADDEYYSAMLLLFNAVELVFKSIRDKYTDNFEKDINDLYAKHLLTANEKDYLNNSDTGVRKIRNIMCHRDAYAHFIELDGIGYSLADMDTWRTLYNIIAPKVITILSNALSKIC